MLLESTELSSPPVIASVVQGPETLISFRVPGAMLLALPQASPASVDAALKSLRGARVSGRRAVWCNLGDIARMPGNDMRSWGRRLVDDGGIDMLVAFGAGSRELAVGARDAGLPIGRVVVCRDEANARNVLGDSLDVGDAALILGVSLEACQRLADRLESRLERRIQQATGI